MGVWCGVHQAGVRRQHEPPDHRDRDDRGHHREVVRDLEQALEPLDPAIQQHRRGERDNQGQRHPDDDEVRRVERSLPERLVLQRLDVVVEPNPVDCERRPEVPLPHIREAHPQRAQHRPRRERQEQHHERQRRAQTLGEDAVGGQLSSEDLRADPERQAAPEGQRQARQTGERGRRDRDDDQQEEVLRRQLRVERPEHDAGEAIKPGQPPDVRLPGAQNRVAGSQLVKRKRELTSRPRKLGLFV